MKQVICARVDLNAEFSIENVWTGCMLITTKLHLTSASSKTFRSHKVYKKPAIVLTENLECGTWGRSIFMI